MSNVTGKTSIRIDELVEDTIISGRVANGKLILTTRGGNDILAGDVGAASTKVDKYTLADGADLNTLVTSGNYRGGTLTNGPLTGGFIIVSGSGGSYATQIFQNYAGTRTWIRTNNAGTWSSWRELATAGVGDDQLRLATRMRDLGIVEGASQTSIYRPAWTYLTFPNAGYLAGVYGSVSSYTRIAMPADGTVIQGHGGSTNVTVSAGSIPAPSTGLNGVLWLDPAFGGGTPSFHISGYGTAWTPPPTWIPIYEWVSTALSGGIGRFVITVDSWSNDSQLLVAPPTSIFTISSHLIATASWWQLSSYVTNTPAKVRSKEAVTRSAGKFTFNKTGLFRVSFTIAWTASNAAGERATWLNFNSTGAPAATTDYRNWRLDMAPGPGFPQLSGTMDFYAASGDYCYLFAYQSSGGNMNVGGYNGDQISFQYQGAW